jgi:arsenate reductase
MEKQRVLFLCTGNSARSQMSEAFLRKYGGEMFEVHSAGLEPTVINPFTVKVLEEVGIDTSNQHAKSLVIYLGKTHFSYLITVCANAEERCPVFPGMGTRLHWPFEDPAAFVGSDEEKTEIFREIRDQIEAKIKSWLMDLG